MLAVQDVVAHKAAQPGGAGARPGNTGDGEDDDEEVEAFDDAHLVALHSHLVGVVKAARLPRVNGLCAAAWYVFRCLAPAYGAWAHVRFAFNIRAPDTHTLPCTLRSGALSALSDCTGDAGAEAETRALAFACVSLLDAAYPVLEAYSTLLGMLGRGPSVYFAWLVDSRDHKSRT